MRAQAWETVNVPAGQFKALRFTNEIKFTAPRFFTHGFREAGNPMVRTRSGPVGRARKPRKLLRRRFDHHAALQ